MSFSFVTMCEDYVIKASQLTSLSTNVIMTVKHRKVKS